MEEENIFYNFSEHIVIFTYTVHTITDAFENNNKIYRQMITGYGIILYLPRRYIAIHIT